jgi:aryl-alcohol dehydrogenase-like predicted oxidoreductase
MHRPDLTIKEGEMDDQKAIGPFRLGPDGPHIGTLGIGTMAWGARLLWGYGREYTDLDLRAAFEITLDAGITFYDTAEVYARGASEKLLGGFIREADVEAVVATKYFPFPWRLGRKAVIKALRRSLERLGMEQVDLYQIHWPSPLPSIETLMEGLADAVEAGLTKTAGVSNYNVEQMSRASDALAKRGLPLASNQVQYSLLHRQPESSGLLDLCRELDVTLIAYSPLGQGMLTGKYTPKNPPKGMRGRRYRGESLTRLQPLIELMRGIGETHGGKTPAQVALNWIVAKGVLPIPGVKNARQAEENVGALNWSLTEAEVAALDEAAQRVSR